MSPEEAETEVERVFNLYDCDGSGTVDYNGSRYH
jgi:Ca2+-binding EF-hand superfamily protein